MIPLKALESYKACSRCHKIKSKKEFYTYKQDCSGVIKSYRRGRCKVCDRDNRNSNRFHSDM